MVEFWGTWCPPCRQSIPHLTKIQKKFSGDVTVIGISGEEIPVVEEFVQAMGSVMDYRVAIDRSNLSSAVYMSAFSVRGIPHAFIVHKGKITWHGHPLAGLDKELSRLIQPVSQAGTPTQTVPSVRKSGGETTGVAQKLSGSTTSNVLAGGFVPRDTTIKKGKYVIAGMFHIPAGVTMTIDPGAQLVFQQNKGMSIGGALKARGTGSAPVLFTGEVKQNGSWGGILFYNTNHVDNVLDHVVIEYGGGGEILANLVLFTNKQYEPVHVKLINSTIRHSGKLGIWVCEWGSISIGNVVYSNNLQDNYWGPTPR